MKQLISTVVLLLAAQCIWAHALWIETASTGARGQAQQIKILMAEAGEKPEPTEGKEWAAVKNFELYVIAPDGKQIKLSTTPQTDYYAATFTPEIDGQYIILLKHENVGVLSFNPTHPFVPYMYATAQVLVGATVEKATVTALQQAPPLYLRATNNKEKKEVTIAIHNTKNKAVSIEMISPDGKTARFSGKEPGNAMFNTPVQGTYQVEAMIADETPGSFKGKPYKTAYYIATFTITVP